jgi:acyl-[acyl-carrier-protein]-phospholipid O-acyltransferase/long-chain-fatty-acid--[acyl-carrier-protein] ligase
MGALLKLRGFLPFVSILFINAFVDLGHKIIIQNTVFKIYDGQTQIILTSIVNGLILLPFILLFSPAGFLADRFAKPRVMRLSAAAAIAITLMITLSYYMGWFIIAFAMTFLLAVQSAIYSPAKYGYIRELVGKEQLATANGVVQAVTIVAILLGVLAFSVLFENSLVNVTYNSEHDILQHIAPLGWLLVLLSVIEYLQARTLPLTQQERPAMQFDMRNYRSGHYLKTNLKMVTSHKAIWLSIVGLSVFWGIAQVLLASFPAYAKGSLGITDTVVIQGLLACSSIGIIAGSLLAGAASHRHIETGLVPLGSIGIVAGMLLLQNVESTTWLFFNFILFGFAGGLFIVPLNSLIQFHAREEELGTVLAGNNWVQNVVMLSFLVLTAILARIGASSTDLFAILTVAAVLGATYTLYQLPQSLIRFMVGKLFSSQYKIEVIGLEHLPSRGPVLMLGNHISWLDWAMIQIASPRPIRFVMHRGLYQKWFMKKFLDFFGVIPISGAASRESFKRINELLRNGEVVCLFPEGAISRNGQLGEFRKGFEKTVEDVDGIILPFYLRGLWGSRFSRASEKLQEGRNPSYRGNVIVAFGEPMPINSEAHQVKQKIFELSATSWEEYADSFDPIALEWLRSAKRQRNSMCLADIQPEQTFSGYKTITGVLAIAGLIRKRSPEQNIGLLLPTSSAGVMSNLAVLLLGKTVINLNFTANAGALKAAIEKAGIRSVYTSRRFLDKLDKKGIDMTPVLEGLMVYQLEDAKTDISQLTRVMLYLSSILLPARVLYSLFGHHVPITQTATILFSSGSEGVPKGVILTHRNLMSNVRQVADVLDTRHDDVVMNSLPLFHAFGLTVTSLMPQIEGIPAVCHPDPTDTLNISKGIARFRATIFFGTGTFLGMFTRNRRIHPLMLDSLRLVVAGAERLAGSVRESFKLKFHKEIYEGYGATETSPVASVNIPDRLDTADWDLQIGNKIGTVGLPVPGTSFRIVDPQTMEILPIGEDGLILINGVQVMPGYLDNPEKTAEAIVEIDGRRWYRTGDKGHLDIDGYLTIVDRYSRFAKIGGEMVSLGAVESGIREMLTEEVDILSTAIPDGRKGEKVILLFAGEITEDELKTLIDQSSLNSLMKPAALLKVDTIPRLGSGKNDLAGAKVLAMQAFPAKD